MANLIQHNNKTLTASEYYYGVPYNFWDNMLYQEAIKDRYKRVKEIYFNLLDTELKTFDDKIRFHKVEKAMKDCKEILDERGL
jgi:hypothetical protein